MMETEFSSLRTLLIISLILPVVFINKFTIILFLAAIYLWYDFFTIKSAMVKLGIECKTEYKKVFTNEEFEVRVTLKNNSGRQLKILLTPPTGLNRTFPREERVLLKKHEVKTIVFKSSFAKRGIKIIDMITATLNHPFNLYTIRKMVDISDSIDVIPEQAMSDFHKESLKKLLPERRSNYRVVEDTTYIDNINEYNYEPLNRIHWKVSAKMDKLMVKKYSYTSTGKVFMFLDLNILGGSPLNNSVWREIRSIYEEYAIRAAAGMIKEIKERNEELNLFVISKEYKKYNFKDWMEFFYVLSEAEGTPDGVIRLEEIINQELPYMTYEDTIIIMSLYLNDESLETLIKLRSRASKVIALVMPYGYREIHEAKLDIKDEMFRKEVEELKEKAKILEENHIIVRLVQPNDSLSEVFNNVP